MVECEGCKELRDQLALALKRIAELEARLAMYDNAHTPPSLKRYPDKRKSESSGRLGRPPGYEGTTRPTPKPDKQIVVLKKQCNACGSMLGEPSEFVSRIIEEIPKPLPRIVTEFKLGYYHCRCGHSNIAEHADCPREGVLGLRALSQIALLKYECRLPCRLVCTALERDYGLLVTPATVLAANQRVANGLQNEYNAIMRRIRHASVLYIDETSFKVGGVKYWLWAFCTPTETLVVIRPSRSKKVLREVVGTEFTGLIVCDGWKTYSNFTDKLQRCWAHVLRESKNASEFEDEAVPLHKALKKLFRRLVSDLESNPSFERRLALHRNAVQVLRFWLSKEWQSERVRKLVGKIRNGSKHWFTFVLVPGVEPTNNRAERALREHVVIRKIIGTLRNGKGIRAHEVIMSVLASWRQEQAVTENVDFRERLVDALRVKAS